MSRGPSLRIPSVAGAVKGADAADFARRVGTEPRYVDVTFTADTSAAARHGLGRRYIGGLVIGVSTGHASLIAVGTPESIVQDASEFFLVRAQTAYTGTVRVWVF
jgi:hypothetical protein